MEKVGWERCPIHAWSHSNSRLTSPVIHHHHHHYLHQYTQRKEVYNTTTMDYCQFFLLFLLSLSALHTRLPFSSAGSLQKNGAFLRARSSAFSPLSPILHPTTFSSLHSIDTQIHTSLDVYVYLYQWREEDNAIMPSS